MSGSSFVLTLLLITTVAAASADHPAFWLLLGPAPIATLMGAVVFMRSKGPAREVISNQQTESVLMSSMIAFSAHRLLTY